MNNYKCKMCGGTIEFNSGDLFGTCDSCGVQMKLEELENDHEVNADDRVNGFIGNNEFHEENCHNNDSVKGPNIRYCTNCGAQLTPGAAVCIRCGSIADSGTQFTQPENPMYQKIGNYDKITLAIICFFFGFIGVHNFMLGETKKGVFKIVMTFCYGISVIFALVDFVKILTGSYVVDTEKII